MATWPATLPAPGPSGYKITPFDPVIRSNMEAGNTRSRRISFAQNDTVTVIFNFSDAELATFRDWHHDSDGADGGAAWFDGLSLPLGFGGLTAVEAKFAKMFEPAPIDSTLRWTVTASLEIRYV